MSFPALQGAADDPIFRRGAIAVIYLHLLPPRLDFTDFRIVKVESTARRLHLKAKTVSRALRALKASGYLESDQYDGRTNTYRLTHTRTR